MGSLTMSQGTSFFMPVEVKAHRYYFNGRYWDDPRTPVPSDSSSDDDDDDPVILALKRRRPAAPERPPEPKPVFIPDPEHTMKHRNWLVINKRPIRYNPIHDVEALWWVTTYFLMTRTVAADVDSLDEEGKRVRDAHIETLHESAQRLFLDHTRRLYAFKSESDFSRELGSLHRSLRKVGLAMDDARSAIVRAYHYVERDIENREFSIQDEMYDTFAYHLECASKYLRTRDVQTERTGLWPY